MSKLFDFKNSINGEELEKIKEIILNDGIVVMPTETVYGIGANISCQNTIFSVFF